MEPAGQTGAKKHRQTRLWSGGKRARKACNVIANTIPQFAPFSRINFNLVIVVVLFGVGRIGKVGSELGTAMREFRKGLSGEEQTTDETEKSK